MKWAKWAKRRAKRKRPVPDFRYLVTKDRLQIAVVHESGEWAAWDARITAGDCGDRGRK